MLLNPKKVLLIFTIPLLSLIQLHAQNYMVNSGCVVSIPQGTKLHLNGSLINQNTGLFINEDSIYITGDITQTASNNLFQTPGQGTVLLIGANQQIGGSSITYFNNLSLQGTGIKSIALNSRIKGILNLNDREFATGNNTLFIDNSDTSAIDRTTGFVSSALPGFIQRSMAQKGNYLFPVGQSSSGNFYRPLIITAPNSGADTFKVNMLEYDATNDGYDINDKENYLCLVNGDYYHNIARQPGNLSQVQLTFYFDSLNDAGYNRIAHWQGTNPQWENTSSPSSLIYLSSPQLSSISIMKWNNFNPTPFALALTNPDATITYVPPICITSSPLNLTANTPGGTWSGTGITNPVSGTFNPQQTGPGTFTVYYDITSSNGCTATDSTSVIVEASPTPSFSTNISGYNVSFTNNSSNATSYYWEFGDGNTSNLSAPSHTYAASGTYTVILYATNSCGTDSTSQTININNSGINDYNSICNQIDIYPNPFNNSTRLSFTIYEKTNVLAELFNVAGEKISVIIPKTTFYAGKYYADIKSEIFNYVPGVYFLRIYVNDLIINKRIISL